MELNKIRNELRRKIQNLKSNISDYEKSGNTELITGVKTLKNELDKAETLLKCVNNQITEITKVKFITEINAEIDNDEIPEDERFTSFSLYECFSCHWRFYGDIVRFGYGYDSEGKQTPDYCPGCGKKIEDEFAE